MPIVDDARLVTLVGAPGCGKTRLSLEVSRRLADRYPAGVGFIELAPVGDGCLVASAVAAGLGIEDQALRSAEDALIEELSSNGRLMVLDNCEHLAGAVAALVARLLDGCPSLRVLATSRTALGLSGEQVWRVPPLDLAPAVELFSDRAGLSAPGAGPDPSSALVIEEICQRLDGLPLAIELAAAWSRVLTPTEILDRLEPALALLRSHVRDASPRQRTMEATLDWSYQLLEPAEQLLFEQLSVFAGGFDFEAAQALVPGEDVLDGLASLVDSSLVLADPASEKMRYRLLEPVRQYAEARLVARGLRDATLRHHAEHYLTLALRSEAKLRSSDAGTVLAQLEEEDDNFRVALGWARDQSDDLGLRLCTALAPCVGDPRPGQRGTGLARGDAAAACRGQRILGCGPAVWPAQVAWPGDSATTCRPERCWTRALPSAGNWTIRWVSLGACAAWPSWPWPKETSTRPGGCARRAFPCSVVTVTSTASASRWRSWA